MGKESKKSRRPRAKPDDELFELVEEPVQNGEIRTGIDRLYGMVDAKGVKLSVLQARLKVDRKVLLYWIRVLEEHNLLKTRYRVVGDPVVSRP